MYNYPKEIKAFYMRLNDDKKTVAAMDVLVPKVCYYLFTVIHETLAYICNALCVCKFL